MSLHTNNDLASITAGVEEMFKEVVANGVYNDECLSVIKSSGNLVQGYWITLPYMILQRLNDSKSGVSPFEWEMFNCVIMSNLASISGVSIDESLKLNTIIISARLKAWIEELQLNIDHQDLNETIITPKELAAILVKLGESRITTPTRTRIARALTYLTNPSYDSHEKNIQNAEILELSKERKSQLVQVFDELIKSI